MATRQTGGAPWPEGADHYRKHSNHNPTRPRPYAAGWRDGFKAGALDALRQAGRWLPPDVHTWAILEDLAIAYSLACSKQSASRE
ncbi:hypothetical protein A5679_17375 [Mycobacterium scrofulaceum]|uniref:Uncharacterized protein n=1 Tax=Mycobacterium scrofulaceum TaxID=1783 RepID=A0A1A2VQJ3_MYCSC|nr:hypothetical protein A5679_17375 [Mycobacterium scrofulaceum]